jgi:formylglycine-generating enzyme required for sulfatase activity
MDLRKAYETLGVARGASAAEVEAAFERLRNDVDARLSRVQAGPVAARFLEVRARLDTARATILAAPAPAPDEPLAHAFEVLGLAPSASPLDVASAYVALCEEIDREIRDASTEQLRRACLEARADVDAAYQRCALSPLHEVAEPDAGDADGSEPAHYETQMAAAPFEAPEAPAPTGPVLRIEPEPEVESRRAHRRRRRLRRVAVAASWLLLIVGGSAAGVWWLGIDPRASLEQYVPEAVMSRLAPPGPPPELIEAQSTAESLRRRVAEERIELQSRVEQTRARVETLERTWSSVEDPAERERMAAELERLRARRDLAIQHASLAEQHVLSGEDLTVAYGKMGQANELKLAGDDDAALAAYSDARRRLEAALARLDLVEDAVGARSEAEAGLEAWHALAASADLPEHEAANRGTQTLASARELLATGRFEQAIPELQRAAQQFATAVADGRKVVAAARAAEAAERAALAGSPADDADAAALAGADSAPAPAPTAAASPRPQPSPPVPSVSAAPPNRDRAAIKRVKVPAGEFLYGAPARRVSLGAFLIDRTEVRVGEYRACVDAGACSEPGVDDGCNWAYADRGDHPVNCVSWEQARDYCSWVGKRLPSEREWEKAARGTDGRVYPWGNDDASCTQAVIAGTGAPGCGRDSTSPVASRAEGRSPFGLFDMAGNVLEWTADEADAGERVVRGGSWMSPAGPARSSYRDHKDATARDADIGFRCAQNDGLYASSGP